MRIGPLLYSQVFTRGSVPVFWEQVAQGKGNLYEDVVLTRSFDMTQGPFKAHMDSMLSDYSRLTIVDLL